MFRLELVNIISTYLGKKFYEFESDFLLLKKSLKIFGQKLEIPALVAMRWRQGLHYHHGNKMQDGWRHQESSSKNLQNNLRQ